jgi:hypothetical protein
MSEAFADYPAGVWYRHERDTEPVRCDGCGDIIRTTEPMLLGQDDAYHAHCAHDWISEPKPGA